MTENQYIRSNKAVYPILMLIFGTVMLTVVGAIFKNGFDINLLLQIVGIFGGRDMKEVMKCQLPAYKQKGVEHLFPNKLFFFS